MQLIALPLNISLNPHRVIGGKKVERIGTEGTNHSITVEAAKLWQLMTKEASEIAERKAAGEETMK